MIPTSYPTVYESETTKMVAYVLIDVTGLVPWVDFIPVKRVSSNNENRYEVDGFIATAELGDPGELVAWKDYIPVYVDDTKTKPWSSDASGYIPITGE